MLTVMGIILLLIGMAIAGFNQVAKHAKAQHTKVALETVKAMMAEFEASAGKQNYSNFRGYYDASIVPVDASKAPSISVVKIPGTPVISIRWDEFTGKCLAQLLTLPNNKAIFDKLPSEQVASVTINGQNYYQLLDGYGHPCSSSRASA